MALRNTDKTYGSLAKWFHWISALTIFGLFGLGLWMRTLGYYDEWYQTAPNIHKSIGILLAVLILSRLVWRWINPQPHDPTHKPIEQFAATWTHRIFYVLLLGMFVAGYLISTSDGRALEVFNLFSIPSVYQKTGLEAQAGLVHEYMAYGIIALGCPAYCRGAETSHNR